jgi:hypothetical protein
MPQLSSQQLFRFDSSPMYSGPGQKPHSKTEYNSRIPISTRSSAWCPRDDDVDQVVFLGDNVEGRHKRVVDLMHPASLSTDNFNPTFPASDSTSTSNLRTDSLAPAENAEHAKDDAALQKQPTRYVDYLSHDWEEEDICLSWKHVNSNRKACDESARLANTLWRTWIKLRYQLKTVSAEDLDW